MEWGSVSDWFSFACNAVMAGVAVYAAKHAKDWLSPKLNERKFKFADELIDAFCKLQQEAFYLHSDAKQIINIDPDVQGSTDSFRKHWNDLSKRQLDYRKNAISLTITLERMVLWGLQPKNVDEFKDILDAHIKLSHIIDNALSIGPDDTTSRLENCFKYDIPISERYNKMRLAHNKIMKHYSKLFID
ncbi:hypothetical protein ACVF21_004189 [Cronobacter sakazakii]